MLMEVGASSFPQIDKNRAFEVKNLVLRGLHKAGARPGEAKGRIGRTVTSGLKFLIKLILR